MARVYNMSPNKNIMPSQDFKKCIKNFDEVSIGIDKETAINEANRCLNCKNPECVQGCPVKINIPIFIDEIRNGNFEKAYQIISQSSAFPAVCGRVCPQETQCESNCLRGLNGEPVGIGMLERFVADWHNDNVKNCDAVTEKNGHKVAIIGSGPSGLACASELLKLGYNVTIFEALHKAGGVLVYGIPEFRLPKKIVDIEIERLKRNGANILTNVVFGKTITVDDIICDGYEAIYIASGAGLPKFMNIKGESLNGVYSANEYLTRCNLMKAYDNNFDTPISKGGIVAVVGGGNVAIDSARTALRLGAEKVYIIYRRSQKELPARKEEVDHAIKEGIEFMFLTNPIEILSDSKKSKKNGFVTGIKCVKMTLGEPDENGRRRPIVQENSKFELNVNTVIMALGTSTNPLIKNSISEIKVNEKGCIIVDETFKTSIDGIYAGGDVVTGSATVISAMGAGKIAANSIDNYLKLKNN